MWPFVDSWFPGRSTEDEQIEKNLECLENDRNKMLHLRQYSFWHPKFKFSFTQSPKRGLKRVTCHMNLTVFCLKKVFCEKTDLKSRLEIKQAAFQQELKHSEQTRELITTFYIPEQLTVKSCKSFISVSVLFSWLFIPFLLENSNFTPQFGNFGQFLT